MKYNKAIVERVYELKSSGEYTDKEIQQILKISHETWHKWKNTKSEFSETLKRAEDYFINEKLKSAARKGLKTLVEGKEVEEITVEYRLVKVKNDKGEMVEQAKKVGEKRTKKVFMPNSTAVIFALKNVDVENFKDRHDLNHTGGISILDIPDDEDEPID